MAVLVTGGAGYIGSHMVQRLRRAGRPVVVVDDLSAGRREQVPADVPFVCADVGDRPSMRRVLRTHRIDSVVHFAGRIEVTESIENPRRYYMGNVAAGVNLVEEVLDAGVGIFVFSSTAAVYGIPETVPITEDAPTRPINPYGETKLAIERMLTAYANAYPIKYAALRYFNAAGAGPGLGERHEPESHLLPIVLETAIGQRSNFVVRGRDYPTRDGTCVRDYVHVIDLADAHLAAIDWLAAGGESGAFNLGTGVGHTVEEVLDTCRAVTGRPIPAIAGPRRPGDPAVLVASSRRAAERLGWRPLRSSLEEIVRDAWAWHSRGRVPRPNAGQPLGDAHVR